MRKIGACHIHKRLSLPESTAYFMAINQQSPAQYENNRGDRVAGMAGTGRQARNSRLTI